MAKQLEMPLTIDQKNLEEFLAKWCTFEDEEERLREEKRILKERYADYLPMRAVLTAVKVVRAERKLAAHPQDPMPPWQLVTLKTLVERWMEDDIQTKAAAGAEAEGS